MMSERRRSGLTGLDVVESNALRPGQVVIGRLGVDGRRRMYVCKVGTILVRRDRTAPRSRRWYWSVSVRSPLRSPVPECRDGWAFTRLGARRAARRAW